MPFTRPSNYLIWTVGNPGVQVEPTNGQQFGGYVANQRPSPGILNWNLATVSEWIQWLDQQEQLNGAQFAYDATVGTGGTYPDINSLVAAITGGAPINNVLVTTLQTLTATQVITSGITDLWIDFKQGAYYTKGLTTTPGISIQGQRITLNGGRFTSFNGGSDVAVQLESASRNCRIINCNFISNTTDINDLGTNNTLANNIHEI